MRLAQSTLAPKTAANLDKLARAISLLDAGHHAYLSLSHLSEVPMLVLHGLMKKNVDALNELLALHGKKLLVLWANEIELINLDSANDVPDLESYEVFGLANSPTEADKKTGVVDEQAPLSPVHPATRPHDSRPTASQFTAYQSMFDYFNASLFGGKLPQVILNLSRMSKAHGFFAPSRWSGRASNSDNLIDVIFEVEAMHEISLNPDSLSREPLAVLGTLVHEMCHLQRQVTGKAPRSGYHDKQWADMMLAVGLTPTHTGEAGGKMVGQRVTHIIDIPGAFYSAYLAMPTEYLLPFNHVAIIDKVKAKKKAASKTKYTCPGCETNIWGKPGLLVTCSDCEESFTEEQKDEDDENN